MGGVARVATISVDETGFIRLVFDGLACYRIAPNGSSVELTREAVGEDPAQEQMVRWGPVAALADALRGRFHLHASAALFGDRMALLVGASGSGKSTMVTSPGGHPPWRRIADDILPVGLEGGNLWAFPRFPQLKLPAEEQYHQNAPERLPVTGIYDLAPPDGSGRILVEPLSVREAMLLLTSQTVAARLFPPQLLESHLEFCARAAELVPARRLTYPRALALLPSVREVVCRDLVALDGRRRAPVEPPEEHPSR